MEAGVHADEDNNAYVGQQNCYVREEEEEEDRVDGNLSHFQPLQLEGQTVDGVVFHQPQAAKSKNGIYYNADGSFASDEQPSVRYHTFVGKKK